MNIYFCDILLMIIALIILNKLFTICSWNHFKFNYRLSYKNAFIVFLKLLIGLILFLFICLITCLKLRMFMFAMLIAQVNHLSSFPNVPYTYVDIFIYLTFTHLCIRGMCRVNDEIFVIDFSLLSLIILHNLYTLTITFFFPNNDLVSMNCSSTVHFEKPSWEIDDFCDNLAPLPKESCPREK